MLGTQDQVEVVAGIGELVDPHGVSTSVSAQRFADPSVGSGSP
jgi:hypothetical protein